MDDDLMLSLSFPRVAILLILLAGLLLPLFDDPSNPRTKISCLYPTSVG